MNTKPIRTLLALGSALLPGTLLAGQAEVDFNDLFLGKTRTTNSADQDNFGNFNTGSGFSPQGAGIANANAGEYDNNTGVILLVAGDIPVPAGVSNFVSTQVPDINGGTGVTLSSSNGSTFRRMQEREFAAPLLGGEVWFSFLFRVEGPDAQGAVIFNHPYTAGAADSGGAFDIHLGHHSTPGAITIMTDTTSFDLVGDSFLGFAGTSAMYYEDTNGDGFLDPGEDLDGNNMLNGVDINDNAPHLIVGRIQVDASGLDDQIDVWLDPADALSLGAPTISVLSDEVDSATGVFSVAFEGVRREVPQGDDGFGNFGFGGRCDLDHFRISDAVDAQDYVTGNALPDPSLDIAADTPAATFIFGATYGTTLPVTAAPLTVKLINNGAAEDIVINSIGFQNGNLDGAFALTSVPATPLTLGPGQSTTITMEAASSAITGQTFSETIVIDTDEDTPDNPQDRNIPVSAQFFPAGFKVNPNPSFDANLTAWESAEFVAPNSLPVRRLPGFNFTDANVRIKGVGDISNGAAVAENPIGDNFSQTVPLGAEDWEFTFLFSPLNGDVFENYSGGSSAFFGDRTFQLAIQGNNNIPVAANGTEGQWTDAANGAGTMINLSYQPAGDDFYVFDGSGGGWTALGIGGLAGSIDGPLPAVINADTDGDGMDDEWEDIFFGDGLPPVDPAELAVSDGTGDGDGDFVFDLDEFLNGTDPFDDDTDDDGVLDEFDIPGDGGLDPANPNDEVNWYLVSVKGTGFGTPGASYTVSVSDPNTLNIDQTTAPLTTFQSLDITAHTPGGYTFLSGDVSTDSGAGAFTTSYWIDEVCFWSGQARDPAITVSVQSLTLTSHNGAGGSAVIAVLNGGVSNSLTVSSVDLGGADFVITDPPIPFTVPASGSQLLTIEYIGAGVSTDTAVFNSNDPLTPAVSVPLTGINTTDSQLLGNFDFETPGNDPGNDTDTFAVWVEDTRFVDFGGLIPGSNTSARAAADGNRMVNYLGAPASNFQIDFPFVLFPGSGSRFFNMHLSDSTTTGGQDVVNMRINTNHVFEAFNGAAWTPLPNLDFSAAPLTFSDDADSNGSLDDPGDTKGLYWLRIIGLGWGTPSPTISFELFDSDGATSLGASGPRGTDAIRFYSTTQAQPLRSIRFLTDQISPRYAIDDVVVQTIAPPSQARLVDVSLNAAQDMGTLTFEGLTAGTTYVLLASDDGENFIPVAGSEFTAAAAAESIIVPVDVIADPLVIVVADELSNVVP